MVATPPRRSLARALLLAALLLPPSVGVQPGTALAVAAERTDRKVADPRSAELEERRRELKRRVEAAQAEVAASEATRAEAADALKSAEQAISERNRRLFELARDRSATEARIAALDRDRTELEARVRDEQRLLARLLVQQHLGGQFEPFKLLLSGRDPTDIARLLAYYRAIGEARAETIATLRSHQERVRHLISDAAQARTVLAALARDEAEQRAGLLRERATLARVLERVAGDLKRQRQELDRLKRDDSRLAALIERLARIARARPPSSPGGVAPSPAPPLAAGTFAALRGMLSMPVRGELAGRFGTLREDGGTLWKGWFIRCPAGREVHAVAAGQVVFADWLRGFGNLLILDHGSGYMSLYAYNDALLATVGRTVLEGEPVAQAGASGGGVEPGVYFEIRFQGRAVDPALWIRR